MQNSSDDDLSLTKGISDDDFMAAFEQVRDKSQPDAAEEVKEESGQAETEVEAAAEDNQEDEQTEETEGEPEQEAASEEAETETDEGASEEDEQADPEPLDHWSADQKEIFEGLDGKGKELVLDRHRLLEKSYDKKFQDLARQRKETEEGLQQVNAYVRAVKPYETLLATVGATPEGAAGQIMALWQGLNDDPAGSMAKIATEFVTKRGGAGSPLASEAVRQVARQLRVDLDGLDDLDAQAGDPLPEQDSEVIAQLRQELQDLRGKFDGAQEADHEARVAQGVRIWEKFRSDPANAHAERLEQEILEQAQSRAGQAIAAPDERLKWAYERAVMIDPTANAERLQREREKLREELVAEREKLRASQSAAVRKVPTKKAKAASTSPQPAAPVTTPKPDDKDMSWEQAFSVGHSELFGDAANRV